MSNMMLYGRFWLEGVCLQVVFADSGISTDRAESEKCPTNTL